ncbi:hypothetical protein NKJ59_02555 [Mesorhizobium australicum]|uniref:hypothetical protein n=1 Tax=Mesorhizobium australicum TaxID=536018 RepID=UPI0033373307
MSKKTIADAIKAGESIHVNCGHPMCNHSVKLDLELLGVRLGLDHGAMHNDLFRVFRCERCKLAGRVQRPVFFTCVPNYGAIDARRLVPRLVPDG